MFGQFPNLRCLDLDHFRAREMHYVYAIERPQPKQHFATSQRRQGGESSGYHQTQTEVPRI